MNIATASHDQRCWHYTIYNYVTGSFAIACNYSGSGCKTRVRWYGVDMHSSEFLEILKTRQITFCSGVPDSTFSSVFQAMLDDPDINYVNAVREDVALGIASAAYFKNEVGAVIMQNSGMGNVINALTSFNLMYKIPVLIIVGWRGYSTDAPEHEIMGKKTPEFFDLLDIPYKIPDEDNLPDEIDELLVQMETECIPGALILRSGVVQ